MFPTTCMILNKGEEGPEIITYHEFCDSIEDIIRFTSKQMYDFFHSYYRLPFKEEKKYEDFLCDLGVFCSEPFRCYYIDTEKLVITDICNQYIFDKIHEVVPLKE